MRHKRPLAARRFKPLDTPLDTQDLLPQRRRRCSSRCPSRFPASASPAILSSPHEELPRFTSSRPRDGRRQG
ncbi:MAG: hypothetical protein ACJAYU_001280 [Bradymonadia bacterium]